MKTFFGRRPGRALRFLVMAPLWIAFLALVIGLVMLLWNWLMPALFVGAKTIGYWQALGLLALCKILFGGGRGRGGPGGWGAQRRWERMTPEEREQLQERFQGRCGPWGRWGDARKADGAATGVPPRAE